MLRSFKRFAIVSAAVIAIAGLFPATSGASVAAAPCQARDLFKVQDWSHTASLTGHYAAPGALDVQLTCGIVQNGQTVTRVTESAPGPVAVIATTVNIAGQYYSVCYEAVVTYVERTTTTGNCP